MAANRGTTPIADYAYTNNAIGQRTQIVELDGTTKSYTYDLPGRLTIESVSGGLLPSYTKTFAYDALTIASVPRVAARGEIA